MLVARMLPRAVGLHTYTTGSGGGCGTVDDRLRLPGPSGFPGDGSGAAGSSSCRGGPHEDTLLELPDVDGLRDVVVHPRREALPRDQGHGRACSRSGGWTRGNRSRFGGTVRAMEGIDEEERGSGGELGGRR